QGRFEAMAIETEKNAASGSTIIDENRDRDDTRQQPKKKGLTLHHGNNVFDYTVGEKNGINIFKSIDEVPFQMGKFRETIAEGEEYTLHLVLKRARVYSDLSPEDKERYNMLLKGSELTKEDRESHLYDDFEHFHQNKKENIHDYYVRFIKLINDMRNIKMTMPRMQLNSKFANNMLSEYNTRSIRRLMRLSLDSDFLSMREDFQVALNTLSGDLKREIHDLRDSFMGQITKKREEFGEEFSILHQDIKDLKLGWLMISCERWNNTWKRRRYGDIERGTATITIWAEFVVHFKKQFYPENAKNEAKSRIRKLKQFETIREFKQFTILVLEIPKLSYQDSLFYFLYGLQGWAKTKLERHRVQDLSMVIAHTEALIKFSTRRDRLSRNIRRMLNAIKAKTEVPKVVGKGLHYVEATINGVKVRALVDSGVM
nr:putative retrotransposon Gag domain, aspartic peptidase domain protein [Tanacetum cinerariifolium]